MIQELKKLKKPWILIVVAVLIIGSIIYFSISGKDQVEYVTETAYMGDLKQTVSATGTLKAAEEIELNFKTAGKISEIMVKVGDEVKEGQELASLDASDMALQIRQAQANLSAAYANLKKLEEGAAPEDINVSQENVNSAKTNYDNALKNLEAVKQKAETDNQAAKQAYEDSLVDYENSVNTAGQNIENAKDSAISQIDNDIFQANSALDKIDLVLNDVDLESTFSIKNPQYEINAEANYETAKLIVASTQASVQAAKATRNDASIESALSSCITMLNSVTTALADTSNALYASLSTISLPETSLDSYKATISTQQSACNTAMLSTQSAQQSLVNSRLTKDSQIATAQALVNAKKQAWDSTAAASTQAITNAENQVNTAKSSMDLAQAQLDLKQAPTRTVDLTAQRAVVSQLSAALALARQNYSDTILRAPVDGIVTKINYDKGETAAFASAGSAIGPVIEMLSKNEFEIQVDISESDIAQVKTGDLVEIDFDAFGTDRKFSGHVTRVDPAETIIQDVVYYRVFISLDQEEPEVKSGMTANVIIMTAERKNVLIVPQRAVKRDEQGQRFVDVLENGNKFSKDARVGLKGDDGLIQILSGVNEGDKVIIYTKTNGQ